MLGVSALVPVCLLFVCVDGSFQRFSLGRVVRYFMVLCYSRLPLVILRPSVGAPRRTRRRNVMARRKLGKFAYRFLNKNENVLYRPMLSCETT